MNETGHPSFGRIFEAARLSPIILPGIVSDETLRGLREWVESLAKGGWSEGDESEHSWAEYRLTDETLEAWRLRLPIIEQLTQASVSVIAWLNRFGLGEWIGSHVDASGDLQCVIPITAPIAGHGGQLWVGRLAQVIPAKPGDIVIFNAASRAHGTHSISEPGVERLTLNVRFWLAPDL